jgi:hypothetical protein
MTVNSPEAQPQGVEPSRLSQLIAICDRAACDESPEYVMACALLNAAERLAFTTKDVSSETRHEQTKAFIGHAIEIITRADLPRATANGPATTYKDKRRLTDGESFKWRKVYNDYTFSNCDHEHDGYPRHLVCAECAFELLAHFAAAPRPTVETELTAALAELREMFPGKAVIIRREDSFYPPDCRDSAETNSMVTIKIGYLQSEPKFRSFRSLTACMAQVRAAAQGKVEGGGE